MKILSLFFLLFAFTFTGCTEMQIATHVFKKTTNPAPYSAPPIKVKRKTGKPYYIKGKKYYPMKSSEGYHEKGIASWYGKDFHRKKTANGETYNMFAMTAAHKTLPLPTYVRVTNLENGLSIMVKVNDRGPFKRGRIIDLSYKAANLLGMVRKGTAPVLVEALPASGASLRPVAWGNRITSITPNKRKYSKIKSTGFTNRVSRNKRVAYNKQQAKHHKKSEFKNVSIYVQVGAFGEKSNANNQLKKLSKINTNGYSAILMETNQGGRILNRVRIGPIDTVEEADAILLKVVNNGFNTAIIAVD